MPKRLASFGKHIPNGKTLKKAEFEILKCYGAWNENEMSLLQESCLHRLQANVVFLIIGIHVVPKIHRLKFLDWSIPTLTAFRRALPTCTSMTFPPVGPPQLTKSHLKQHILPLDISVPSMSSQCVNGLTDCHLKELLRF